MLGDVGWGFCDGRDRRAHWGRPKWQFVAVVVGTWVLGGPGHVGIGVGAGVLGAPGGVLFVGTEVA
jgi:hypothetical protein